MSMAFELASRRFTKTSFDTKGDWGSHPPTLYTCPICSGVTKLTRADFESAWARQGEASMKEALRTLHDAARWVWRDWIDAVCPFQCSGCGAQVLVGFQAKPYRRSGRHYWLFAVLEADPRKEGAEA